MKDLEKKIQEDYNQIMDGFTVNPLFAKTDKINTNVHFEQFSVFDKSLKSTAVTSLL